MWLFSRSCCYNAARQKVLSQYLKFCSSAMENTIAMKFVKVIRTYKISNAKHPNCKKSVQPPRRPLGKR